MTLIEKQQLFPLLLVKLIVYAYERGYKLTGGEWWRDPRIAELNAASGSGISNSLHPKRLAIDLNLFRGSQFLTKTEDHRELGEYWKTLHPLCRWGGDFKKQDGNHYSIEHEGVK